MGRDGRGIFTDLDDAHTPHRIKNLKASCNVLQEYPKFNKTAFPLKKSIVSGQGIIESRPMPEAESFNFVTNLN